MGKLLMLALTVGIDAADDVLEGPPPQTISATEALVGGLAIAGAAAGVTWCVMADCLEGDEEPAVPAEGAPSAP